MIPRDTDKNTNKNTDVIPTLYRRDTDTSKSGFGR
jgi:hypothetical protein